MNRYALWDKGKYVGEYTSMEMAKKINVVPPYITQAVTHNYVISHRWQVTRNRLATPLNITMSSNVLMCDVRDGDDVIFTGTISEIAEKFERSSSNVYRALNTGSRLCRKYKIVSRN